MLEIINHPITAQVIGIIAMLIAFLGFLQKDDKYALQILMLSCIFWVFHFVLMGVYAAAAACVISILRIFLSLKYKRNKRIFLGVFFATVVVGALTYENTYSLLPILGSCISVYGYFFYERIKLRLFMIVTSLFWFTFNISINSIGGIISEAVVQIILIVTMVKMLHEEHKRTFIIDAVMNIIEKRRDMHLPDVGRFIHLFDYLKVTKKWLVSIVRNIPYFQKE